MILDARSVRGGNEHVLAALVLNEGVGRLIVLDELRGVDGNGVTVVGLNEVGIAVDFDRLTLEFLGEGDRVFVDREVVSFDVDVDERFAERNDAVHVADRVAEVGDDDRRLLLEVRGLEGAEVDFVALDALEAGEIDHAFDGFAEVIDVFALVAVRFGHDAVVAGVDHVGGGSREVSGDGVAGLGVDAFGADAIRPAVRELHNREISGERILSFGVDILTAVVAPRGEGGVDVVGVDRRHVNAVVDQLDLVGGVVRDDRVVNIDRGADRVEVEIVVGDRNVVELDVRALNADGAAVFSVVVVDERVRNARVADDEERGAEKVDVDRDFIAGRRIDDGLNGRDADRGGIERLDAGRVEVSGVDAASGERDVVVDLNVGEEDVAGFRVDTAAVDADIAEDVGARELNIGVRETGDAGVLVVGEFGVDHDEVRAFAEEDAAARVLRNRAVLEDDDRRVEDRAVLNGNRVGVRAFGYGNVLEGRFGSVVRAQDREDAADVVAAHRDADDFFGRRNRLELREIYLVAGRFIDEQEVLGADRFRRVVLNDGRVFDLRIGLEARIGIVDHSGLGDRRRLLLADEVGDGGHFFDRNVVGNCGVILNDAVVSFVAVANHVSLGVVDVQSRLCVAVLVQNPLAVHVLVQNDRFRIRILVIEIRTVRGDSDDPVVHFALEVRDFVFVVRVVRRFLDCSIIAVGARRHVRAFVFAFENNDFGNVGAKGGDGTGNRRERQFFVATVARQNV